MALSQEYAEYILDMLEPLGNLTSQKMFGGKIIKSDGNQVGVIIQNQFYFRIPKSLREKYLKHGSKPFEYEKKGKWVTVHVWYLAPEETMDNSELFLEWAEEALEKRKQL